MTRHCYDMSVLIDVLRGKRAAERLVESHSGEERATTAVSVYELSLGATTAARERAALELLEPLVLLPRDSHAACSSNLVKNQKMPLSQASCFEGTPTQFAEGLLG